MRQIHYKRIATPFSFPLIGWEESVDDETTHSASKSNPAAIYSAAVGCSAPFRFLLADGRPI